jgi:RNA polymerase sigma-70 factor (ECF subfamily)
MKTRLHKLTDEELIEIVKHKTSDLEIAFQEIYIRYSHKIFAYIKTILIEIEPSEDILQDAFTNFYKSMHKDREVTSIERYIIKIARNLCLNYKRSKKNNLNLDDITNIYVSDPLYDRKELMDIIYRVLDEMDSKYSDAFRYKKLEGYSFKDIAEKMNITTETAKTRVTRARLKLLEELEPFIKDLRKNKV